MHGPNAQSSGHADFSDILPSQKGTTAQGADFDCPGIPKVEGDFSRPRSVEIFSWRVYLSGREPGRAGRVHCLHVSSQVVNSLRLEFLEKRVLRGLQKREPVMG